MKDARRAWFLLLALLLGPTLVFGQLHEAGDGSPGPVKAAHIVAELVPGAASIAPGGATTVALALTMDPGWHVYWANAGDSGEPPSVEWTLPAGVAAGPMRFAAPKRLPLGPLLAFGYDGTAVFPFPLTAAKTLGGGKLRLGAHVRWQVCREVCIPGRGFLGLDLPVSAGAQPPLTEPRILAAMAAEPVALPGKDAARVAGSGGQLQLTVRTGAREAGAEFYPLDQDVIANAASQTVIPTSDGLRLTLTRDDATKPLPKQLNGVLRLASGKSYTIAAPVAKGALAAASPRDEAAGIGFALAVALALGGGLILNLMPCVFPVLFLKALSLVEGAGGERRTQRLHGFAYTGGILVSFWSIVAVLLVLRAGGRQAGWGFQLQSPTFVVLMVSLLFFMALALAGQFEIGLSLTGKGDALTRKSGYTGSFFTGVLATVVATPCTAPLMGAAIGFALSAPAAVTFLVFTALALGLALPYLLLCLQPQWAGLLPKPGRWMETLKQFTAVPLLLTVVWLVWVYGRLFTATPSDGADHIARLLLGLFLLAVAGWALGRWPARRTGLVVAGAFAAASLAVSLTAPAEDAAVWKPFSPAAVAAARTEGRPVFVDFTAAWCLSCQVNERVVLKDGSVERELAAKHFVLLRADWTRYDPEITKQLASVSRSGVPTYVIYPSQPEAQAQVLPELLTKGAVLGAVSALPTVAAR